METRALQDAYQRLIASAARGSFSAPDDPNEWSAELVIAHIIATNQTLSMVGSQMLGGRETTYEGGTLTVAPYWLRSIIESAVDMAGLLTALRQSCGELLALARRFDGEAANKTFPAMIYDGHGKVLWDSPVSFNNVLNNKLVSHLFQYIKQIQALEISVIGRQ